MYTLFHRMTLVTALAFALLMSIMSGSAVARLIDEPRTEAQTSSLAGTTEDPLKSAAAQHPDSLPHYPTPSERQDLPSPDVFDAMRQNEIQLALERYYSTYGDPEPAPVAKAPAPVDGPEPWLPIAIAVAAALAIAAASVTVIRRRHVAA